MTANPPATPVFRGADPETLYSLDDYAGIPASVVGAARGCASPHVIAALQPGEAVLDVGCGAGLDALIAARAVGPQGRVVGLDASREKIEVAREAALSLGLANVSFAEGSMEHIALPAVSFDVVISNCAVNQCRDKAAVLAGVRRVLAQGGRFVVADLVRAEDAPPEELAAAARLLGCSAERLLTRRAYGQLLARAGFARIEFFDAGHAAAAASIMSVVVRCWHD